MADYPYSTPLILTDEIYVRYGGQTGTSTPDQRQAAYLMAEQQMTEHLRTFLVPTVHSGTAWYKGGSLYETEYGHIHQVLLFASRNVPSNGGELQLTSGSAYIRNAEFGYLDAWGDCSPTPCGDLAMYDNLVVYRSGLTSGTAWSPLMLSALSLAALINLSEWDVSLANEGTADIGVQTFSNQGYSESRVRLGRTPFGTSARAQRVTNLTKQFRSKPGVRMR